MEIVIITVAAFALIGFIVGKIIDHCCKHEWETDEKVRVCDHSEIWGDSKYDRYSNVDECFVYYSYCYNRRIKTNWKNN